MGALAEVCSAPFEITEAGWGEFEAGIRIFFKDSDEQPLDIAHTIKLYHGAPGQLHVPSKQPVMSEVYDEVVFTDPAPDFRRQLLTYTPPVARKITDMTEYYTVFSDQEDLRLMTLIQDHLRTELENAKTKLLRLEGDLSAAAQSASVSLASAAATVSSTGGAPAASTAQQGGGRKRSSGAGATKAARAPVSATDRRRSANKGLPPNPKKGAKQPTNTKTAATVS